MKYVSWRQRPITDSAMLKSLHVCLHVILYFSHDLPLVTTGCLVVPWLGSGEKVYIKLSVKVV